MSFIAVSNRTPRNHGDKAPNSVIVRAARFRAVLLRLSVWRVRLDNLHKFHRHVITQGCNYVKWEENG